MNKFKSIYPEKIKAIGQLFATFFLFGVGAKGVLEQMIERVLLGKEGIEGNILILATYNAVANIASALSLGLIILYIVLKIKSKRKMQR